MNKFFQWLFWNTIYFFRPSPSDFRAFTIMLIRKRWPWKKWKPGCFYNEDGKQWEIYMVNEDYYVRAASIKADLHISIDSKKIVGLTIWDSELELKK